MPQALLPSPEFTILDSGLAFGTGTLHHAWFRLADPRGRETVRAVALKELAYLPIETRDDPDVLGKQWAALRGLYNADVDFVFSCLGDLYDHIDDKLKNVPPRDSMLRGVLEGILFRLHPLVQGAAATQYAAGSEAVDLNELVPADFGVAVLEGGAFLDDFSKAFLLGWAAWHLYTDAVVVRMRRGTTEPARIQIVFEEAGSMVNGGWLIQNGQ